MDSEIFSRCRGDGRGSWWALLSPRGKQEQVPVEAGGSDSVGRRL